MSERMCKCSAIQQYSQDPRIPISFDERLNEYHLIDAPEPGDILNLTYCFHCGGKLPESKRGDLFHDLDEKELERFRRMLAEADTVEQVVSILGNPDRSFQPTPPSEIDKEVYGRKTTIQQMDYERLSETMAVTVSEYDDGTFDVVYYGKRRE